MKIPDEPVTVSGELSCIMPLPYWGEKAHVSVRAVSQETCSDGTMSISPEKSDSSECRSFCILIQKVPNLDEPFLRSRKRFFLWGARVFSKNNKKEKRMKKTCALILAVLMLTACCTACSNGKKDDNPTPPADAH